MAVELSRADLTYQVNLKQPTFSLAARVPEMAAILHEVLSPSVSVAPSNIQVLPASNYGEFVLRVSLFNGQGSIEFRIDSYRAQFVGLRAVADLGIVFDCLQALERGAERILAGTSEVLSTEVTLATWLKLGEKGIEVVLAMLNAHSKLELSGRTETEKVSMDVRGSISDPDERWSAKFLLEPSVNKEVDHLFVSLNAQYWPGGLHSGLEARKDHFTALYKYIVEGAGFQFEEGHSK